MTRLDEFDRTEWRDVVRHLEPDLTDEQFDMLWAQFQRERAARALQ